MATKQDKAEQARKAAAEAQASIVEQIAKLRTDDGWRAYLEVVSRFHTYSLNNLMLILSQKPDAEFVAGYRKWLTLDHQVKKGEKGIRIFAPSAYTCKNDSCPDISKLGVDHKHMRFILVSVFDISQTEVVEGGTPIDTGATRLTGEQGSDHLELLTERLHDAGYTISRDSIYPANGRTVPGKKIVLDNDLQPMMQLKTLIHETAHNVLGHVSEDTDYQSHRGLCETEAESVAYVVSSMLGIDTSDYSIKYVGAWAEGDIGLIESTAKRVIEAAAAIHAFIADGVEPETMEGVNAIAA